jgi:hypothetical protein
MSSDFSGFSIEPTVIGWHPGNGEWVLFNMADPDKQVALVEAGAHAARDGSLVGIFQRQQIPPLVVITRADGTIEKSGGVPEPAHIVLVHSNRENLTVPRKKPDGGWELVNVFFFWNSPSVKDVRPLLDMADLPDGHPRDMAVAAHFALKAEAHARTQILPPAILPMTVPVAA